MKTKIIGSIALSIFTLATSMGCGSHTGHQDSWSKSEEKENDDDYDPADDIVAVRIEFHTLGPKSEPVPFIFVSRIEKKGPDKEKFERAMTLSDFLKVARQKHPSENYQIWLERDFIKGTQDSERGFVMFNFKKQDKDSIINKFSSQSIEIIEKNGKKTLDPRVVKGSTFGAQLSGDNFSWYAAHLSKSDASGIFGRDVEITDDLKKAAADFTNALKEISYLGPTPDKAEAEALRLKFAAASKAVLSTPKQEGGVKYTVSGIDAVLKDYVK